jgi:mevalonate kinase
LPVEQIDGSAPGKVILSGEHAVVHGAPALVAAVNRRTRVSVARGAPGCVLLCLPDLDTGVVLTRSDLDALDGRLRRRFDAFLEGDRPIEQVLTRPEDLPALALVLLGRHCPALERSGMALRVRSDVPVGQGMGSSAALVVSLLRTTARFIGCELVDRRLFELALEAERFQHGSPSGADPYVCIHGGLWRYQRGTEPVRLSGTLPEFHLVETGRPLSGTGTCVGDVARRFGNSRIWEEFAQVTESLRYALQRTRGSRAADMADLLRANHRLLCRIGVVPPQPAAFIAELEQLGGAAKISGAGAVSGQAAGIVLVCGVAPPSGLCDRFGYRCLEVALDDTGVRIDR